MKKKKYRCTLCNAIVEDSNEKMCEHMKERHHLEFSRKKVPIYLACKQLFKLEESQPNNENHNSQKVRCKLCDVIVKDNPQTKEQHLIDDHEAELIQMGITAKMACAHFFEPANLRNPLYFEAPSHYKCKLCKAVISTDICSQWEHFLNKHGNLLEKNHMSPTIAAKIYLDPIVLSQKREHINPQPVHFESEEKEDIPKIHSTKLSFVSHLIEGLRGHRCNGQHRCQCCTNICDEPWEYNVDGYRPIYLCESCHRKIKCGNFVPGRIIYSGFETGRKKH